MRMCSAAVRGLTGRARSRRPERAPASRAPGTGAGGRQLPRRAGRLAPCRPSRAWTSSCSKSTSASVRSTASCAQARPSRRARAGPVAEPERVVGLDLGQQRVGLGRPRRVGQPTPAPARDRQVRHSARPQRRADEGPDGRQLAGNRRLGKFARPPSGPFGAKLRHIRGEPRASKRVSIRPFRRSPRRTRRGRACRRDGSRRRAACRRSGRWRSSCPPRAVPPRA